MRIIARALAVIVTIIVGLGYATSPGTAAESAKPHRIAIQIDQNDPALMTLVLNNAENVAEYYQGRGEDVQIEIVAYGPGLNMLRDDTSPVKGRIRRMVEGAWPSTIKFSACGVTKAAMEKKEGHPIPIVPQASVVPSGVVRLNELQEQGWSYIRP